MIEIRALFIDRGIRKTIKSFPASAFSALRAGFRDVSADFVRAFSDERLRKSGSPRDGDGEGGIRQALFRRTGSLARGLTFKVTGGSAADLESRIGWTDAFSAKRAIVHEDGATIRPRNSKFLTIPLKEAMTPAGVSRQPNARSWPNTFFMTSKAGNLLIAQKRGKGFVPLYVLKESVKIPPRLGFVDTWNSTKTRTRRLKILRKALRKAKR